MTKLDFMEGHWSLGKFALSEALTLYKGISHYIENDGHLDE